MEPYHNYVIWLEQNYAVDIVPILEDVLVKFKENPLYKQDPRFIYILVKYVSLPTEGNFGIGNHNGNESCISFRYHLRIILGNCISWCSIKGWEQNAVHCTNTGLKSITK